MMPAMCLQLLRNMQTETACIPVFSLLGRRFTTARITSMVSHSAALVACRSTTSRLALTTPVPYLNLQVKHISTTTGEIDGWGIIALGTPTTQSTTTVGGVVYGSASYDVANCWSGFYEYVNLGVNSSPTSWATTGGWTLLGVGESRKLNLDPANSELAVPNARGPITDGLAILWGDSANNYVGMKDIYNVQVTSGGTTFVAGNVPEPCTIIVWSVLGLAAAGFGCWRRRRA